MTETIPVELQELTERAKVAFARAHPKCAAPAVHVEGDVLYVRDRESGDGGWFRVSTVPGRDAVVRLTRTRPPSHPEPRDHETQDVSIEVVPPPPTTSPRETLVRAIKASREAFEPIIRYCERPVPDLTVATIYMALREASEPLLHFVAARQAVQDALTASASVLERMRAEAQPGRSEPMSALRKLRPSPSPTVTDPPEHDRLEEAVRVAKGEARAVADAWPIIHQHYTAAVATFAEAIPRLYATARDTIQAKAHRLIDDVLRVGTRGCQIDLDYLGHLVQQERAAQGVLDQIRDALSS
jgi:hypothetical protein